MQKDKITGASTQKKVKSISLGVLVALFSFLGAVFIFGAIAHEVLGEKEEQFDLEVFRFLKNVTNDNLVGLAKALSFFGSQYFLIPAYVLIVIFLFIARMRSIAIDVMIIAVSSTALMFLIKNIYRRHRPGLPLLRELNSYSFPSGHALDSFIFCSILIFLVWQTKRRALWKYILAAILLLFSLSIGASRIVLRYHYASDVIAGFALAFAWVIFSFWILKKIKRKAGNAEDRT